MNWGQALCLSLGLVWGLALLLLPLRGPRLKASGGELREGLSVIVPVRDEEARLRLLLPALLAEGGDGLEVIVVDDGSSDSSYSVALEWQAKDSRIRAISAGPLPPGWVGKAWACHRGASLARGRWLLFLDADVGLKPGILRAALQHAAQRGLDALSLRPALRVEGVWGRLVYCVLGFLIRALYPPSLLNRAHSRRGLFFGSFLLTRAEAYRRVGGHESVRGELVEDYALGQAYKRLGLRTELLRGEGWLESRASLSLAEACEMVRRIASAPLDGRRGLALAFSSLLLFLTWAPWALLIAVLFTPLGPIALAPPLLLWLNFWPELREMRLSALYLLGIPLGAAVISYAVFTMSVWYGKRALRWRGRTYGPKAISPAGRDG
ncbi:MAG: hypothetical protein C4339_04055 [Nitrososphaerota archaeon]